MTLPQVRRQERADDPATAPIFSSDLWLPCPVASSPGSVVHTLTMPALTDIEGRACGPDSWRVESLSGFRGQNIALQQRKHLLDLGRPSRWQ